MIRGMSQRVFHVILRPAEANDAHSISVNDPPPVEVIDGTFVRSHFAWPFLHAAMVLHVTARFCSVAYLQDHDPARGERLRRKTAVPRSVDPELALGESVGLED